MFSVSTLVLRVKDPLLIAQYVDMEEIDNLLQIVDV